jgi:glycosyltransferase involved in cell wall biosynthesis
MASLVSINLCCYNSERFLEQTLQSIFAQTLTDWELVVINDGSQDATNSIVRRHIADGRNIIYHSQVNVGLGASRNKAIELSTGKYIALIDHDDVWEPEKLARQVAQMEANDRIGLSYTDAHVVDAAGATLRRYMARELLAQGAVLPQLFLGDFIACSTVMIRRDVIAQVGGFRPELKITEEYDLFLRIAAAGYDFALVDAPLISLRVHGSNASWDVLRTRDENLSVLCDAMRRRPELRHDLGAAVVRMRMAGFAVTPDQASLFRRPIAALREHYRGRSLAAAQDALDGCAKLTVSLLPQQVIKAVLVAATRVRRLKIRD